MTCHLPSLPHSTIYYILKDLTHGRVLYYFETEKQNQNEFRGAMNSKRTPIIKFTKANLHLKSQNQILLFFKLLLNHYFSRQLSQQTYSFHNTITTYSSFKLPQKLCPNTSIHQNQHITGLKPHRKRKTIFPQNSTFITKISYQYIILEAIF